jgi:hypothetical protein
MKYLFWACFLVALAFVFPSILYASTTVLPVFGGGTGISSTPSYGQVLVGNSGGTYTLTATSSLGISGGGGGGISWPWSQLTNWGTSTDATTTSLQVPAVFASSTLASQFPYASSTAFSISGASWLGTILSGIWNGTPIANTYGGTGQNSSAWSALPIISSGTWSQYAGSNCSSHNYASSVNGSGVLTCTQITLTTDVTGTLPVGNGGTGSANIGVSQLLATNASGNAVSTSTPTAAVFNATSTNQPSTFVSASTTNLSIGSYMANPLTELTFYMASSSWGTGTTTITLFNNARPITWVNIMCNTSAGTLETRLYHGTVNNVAYLSASTTANINTFVSNAVLAVSTTTYLDIGNAASSPTNVNCTFEYAHNSSS